MSKRDLTKAKTLLSSHGDVDSFESHCVGPIEHYLVAKFKDGTSQFFRRLSEVQAWVDRRALVSSILAAIARDELGIDSLEVQNRDSLDFHDVHVLSLKKALRDAFEAGARSVQSK